jgi:L-fuculose-phosphate aldolase
MLSDFFTYGRVLWEAGLIHLTSGNLSERRGTAIYVTRTGSHLSRLTAPDILTVNLDDDRRDRNASSETPVHRALYLALPDIGAVAHAHPPYATALSFDMDEVRTVDSDSLYIPVIPVLKDCPYGEGTACVAAHFPGLLGKHKVALIRGHGAFAVGDSLAQCVARLTMMENQCRLVFFRRLLDRR